MFELKNGKVLYQGKVIGHTQTSKIIEQTFVTLTAKAEDNSSLSGNFTINCSTTNKNIEKILSHLKEGDRVNVKGYIGNVWENLVIVRLDGEESSEVKLCEGKQQIMSIHLSITDIEKKGFG